MKITVKYMVVIYEDCVLEKDAWSFPLQSALRLSILHVAILNVNHLLVFEQ